MAAYRSITRGRRRCSSRQWAWVVVVAVWAAWGADVGSAAPHPQPDSDDDVPFPSSASSASTPSSDNALGMLVLSPRTPPIVLVAGGRGSTAQDIMKYYLPVIMAEMDAPVSTRDPSIIRVAGCRAGFNEDPLGGCRPVFVPRSFFPRPASTRPNRQTSIASLLPVRPRPKIPRPQPQTQRDLIRQFNTSRRRPAWFGRSLPEPERLPREPSAASLQELDSPEISLEDTGSSSAATTTGDRHSSASSLGDCDDCDD